uniref:Uncharacterized protein n=1 Tax=Rhizophora mucronata TaxID=61149 RepID=A0A2P2NIM7_RHIMU
MTTRSITRQNSRSFQIADKRNHVSEYQLKK